MSTEAMKLALEALEGIHPGNMTPMAEEYWNKAITALQEALAQPQQEPVAWVGCGECDCSFSCNKGATACIRNANETSTLAVSECTEYEARIKRLGEMLTLQHESGERLAARLMELEALAEQPVQPQQEPVAWANPNDLQNFDLKVRANGGPLHTVPLYTSPPAQEIVCSTGLCHYRKPLTPDLEADTGYSRDERAAFTAGWEAAEAAHGIKGEA